jgi:hypothetical protein
MAKLWKVINQVILKEECLSVYIPFGVVPELSIFVLNRNRSISRCVPCVSTAKFTINEVNDQAGKCIEAEGTKFEYLLQMKLKLV